MARLLVLGAGGYGRTVAEAAAGLFEEIAFLDDRAAAALGPCVDYEKWKGIYQYAYPAFGNNELRRKWLEVLGEPFGRYGAGECCACDGVCRRGKPCVPRRDYKHGCTH